MRRQHRTFVVPADGGLDLTTLGVPKGSVIRAVRANIDVDADASVTVSDLALSWSVGWEESPFGTQYSYGPQAEAVNGDGPWSAARVVDVGASASTDTDCLLSVTAFFEPVSRRTFEVEIEAEHSLAELLVPLFGGDLSQITMVEVEQTLNPDAEEAEIGQVDFADLMREWTFCSINPEGWTIGEPQYAVATMWDDNDEDSTVPVGVWGENLQVTVNGDPGARALISLYTSW